MLTRMPCSSAARQQSARGGSGRVSLGKGVGHDRVRWPQACPRAWLQKWLLLGVGVLWLVRLPLLCLYCLVSNLLWLATALEVQGFWRSRGPKVHSVKSVGSLPVGPGARRLAVLNPCGVTAGPGAGACAWT